MSEHTHPPPSHASAHLLRLIPAHTLLHCLIPSHTHTSSSCPHASTHTHPLPSCQSIHTPPPPHASTNTHTHILPLCHDSANKAADCYCWHEDFQQLALVGIAVIMANELIWIADELICDDSVVSGGTHSGLIRSSMLMPSGSLLWCWCWMLTGSLLIRAVSRPFVTPCCTWAVLP